MQINKIPARDIDDWKSWKGQELWQIIILDE